MYNIEKLKEGDILSEVSHYKVNEIVSDICNLIHIETNTIVNINTGYIKDCINNGDEYESEVRVGKEDKFWTAKQIEEEAKKQNILPEDITVKPGDLRLKGIRTIWEEIYTPHVFTVCFKKQDKLKSNKQLQLETKAIADKFAEEIEKIKTAKKGVTEASIKFVEDLVKNPILPYEEGEERVLRGYKIQFTSRDGKYNCIDMDITDDNNIRPVNINSIQYLIYNNVKYIVE
jgi:hypothetical protein